MIWIIGIVLIVLGYFTHRIVLWIGVAVLAVGLLLLLFEGGNNVDALRALM